jgi:hypothetical protein
MAEGLRREPLFGRKERLYADPEVTPESNPQPKPRAVTPIKKQEPVTQPEESVEEQEVSNMRGWVSTGLELLGIVSLTAGGFVIAEWLGLMILGVSLLVLGVATGYGA